jgi:Rha family phage regulatory protein
MATETLPQTTISVEFLPDGQTPVVSSLDVARHFQKKHKHVLDEIRRIQSIAPKSFTEPNFRPSEYTDPTGRILPCFLLTRDAFSLLAMGFTGKNAIQWKLRYIEAFSALEAAVLDNARAAALESLSAQVIESRRKIIALEEGKALARAEGAQAALSLSPERRDMLEKTLKYRKLGLSNAEIGKLLERGHSIINRYLCLGRQLGLLEASDRTETQQTSMRANLRKGIEAVKARAAAKKEAGGAA